jgi:chromosome segregation ATPase
MKLRGKTQVETHAAAANDLKASQKELETRLQELESSLATLSGEIRAADYAAHLAGYSGDRQRIQATAAICAGLREKRDGLAGEIRAVENSLRSIAAQLPHAKRAADKAKSEAGDAGIRAAAKELHEAAERFFTVNDQYRALRAGFARPQKSWPVPFKLNTWTRKDWLAQFKKYLSGGR